MRRNAILWLLVLSACGAAQPAQHPLDAEQLALRFVPTHPVLHAADDPEDFAGTLVARNLSAAPVTLRYLLSGDRVEWSITGSDGSCFDPTLRPPGIPPVGGFVDNVRTLAPGEEQTLAELVGISGYNRCGDSTWLRGLPAGDYRVIVSHIMLGDAGTFATAPAEISVR